MPRLRWRDSKSQSHLCVCESERASEQKEYLFQDGNIVLKGNSFVGESGVEDGIPRKRNSKCHLRSILLCETGKGKCLF